MLKTERTYTPTQLQTLVKSCQLSSSVFLVRTTISHIHVQTTISRKRSPNFFASALVRNPSRRYVKRSAVLFFASTRLTDLQNVFCFKKVDQHRMVLHLDFSTIFIVCFSIVCRIVTTFDCRHVLLGGMPLHRHRMLGVLQRAQTN